MAHPALELLTDIFAMPHWMPFANVFSIGDVLISVGVGIVIAVAMTAPRPRGRSPGVREAAADVGGQAPADPPADLPAVVEAS